MQEAMQTIIDSQNISLLGPEIWLAVAAMILLLIGAFSNGAAASLIIFSSITSLTSTPRGTGWAAPMLVD